MKKYNTSPLSGMQELLPNEQIIFDYYKKNISDVYHHYGFISIETPIIERTDILFAKAGGDTEKQIYKVSKTAESEDSADQALRFDHTVPLARYVVEHNNDLAFPFQVTQINRNFRGERAQRGRFREFYQCDADIIGREKLPIAYDAKVIACMYDALKTFKLPKMLIRISNRKVLSGFLNHMSLAEKTTEISNVIDHAEKVPEEKSREALKEIGLSDEQIEKVTTFMFAHGDYATVENILFKLMGDLTPVADGLAELKEVFDILNAKGTGNCIIDFMIVRGLDYYTGTVFEIMLEDYREIGSISGGGRYENLASNFTDQKFPGVGGSIGLTRLFFVLREIGLINMEAKKPIDCVVIPISQNEYKACFELAEKYREQGRIVDIDLTDRKLSDRLNRASKIAEYAAVVGNDEVISQKYTAKNLQTGDIIELEA